jgi:hypothetical protein
VVYVVPHCFQLENRGDRYWSRAQSTLLSVPAGEPRRSCRTRRSGNGPVRVESLLRTLGSVGGSLGHKVLCFYMVIAHIRETEVIRLRNKIRDESDTMNVRVEYLLARISKAEMQRRLYTNDLSRRRNTLILNLFELIADVGLEWVWGLCNTHATGEELLELVKEETNKLDELFEYCNREWAKISYDHRITVPVILQPNNHNDFIIKTNLYKMGKEQGISSYEGEDFHNWATHLYTK